MPPGWLEEFHARVDFERSLARLEGLKHFHVDTMRGHLRSLQLRFAEAWKHFDRAEEGSRKAVEDTANLVRQLLLNIYRFELALVEGTLSEKEKQKRIPPSLLPRPPDFLLEEFPEVRSVLNLRLQAEGILALHYGECPEAVSVFEMLTPGGSATAYLGLAAAQHAMGLAAFARSNIEKAAEANRASGDTLGRARTAAVLHAFCAFCAFLEDDAAARGWKAFMESLPCPRETREVFLRRAGIILERSRAEGRLLVL